MILLNPDLEIDSAPASATTSRSFVSETAARALRVPTPRTLARFLALAQTAVRLKGEVNVLLTTDTEIKRLNRQFRGKNKATDVLSFPADGIGAEGMAGDLAISVPTARRQAMEQGHPLLTEIKVLILHGLLHLSGYDHEADDGQMARRERLLRGRLKLPQGLIERVTGGTKGTDPLRTRSAQRLPEAKPAKRQDRPSKARTGTAEGRKRRSQP